MSQTDLSLGPMNTHIHLPPNFSAFETVDEVVDAARAEGLSLLGASNYYDFTVYGPFGKACRAAGIQPLYGLEIVAMDDGLAQARTLVNDPGNPGRVYLCGKAIVWWDKPHGSSASLLASIRTRDASRAEEMTRRLSECFAKAGLDLELSAQRIVNQVASRSHVSPESVVLQERHIARAFQEGLFRRLPVHERSAVLERVYGASVTSAPDGAVPVQGEMRSRLLKAGRPAYVPEDFVSVDEAMALVRGLGGIPCYPVLADGASPVTPYEADVDALIADLQARGITAAEFIPIRNDPEVLERYVLSLSKAGFLVTAGTEHNTLDRIPLTPMCRGAQPIPDAVQRVFTQGALALVGHTLAVARLEEGFGGGPTIAQLARAGEVAIAEPAVRRPLNA